LSYFTVRETNEELKMVCVVVFVLVAGELEFPPHPMVSTTPARRISTMQRLNQWQRANSRFFAGINGNRRNGARNKAELEEGKVCLNTTVMP
jgi:hypothetical protein